MGEALEIESRVIQAGSSGSLLHGTQHIPVVIFTP